MKTAIMGADRLGSYIGERVVRAEHDVTFIARGNHLPALLDNGLVVKSDFGDFQLEKVQAVSNPGASPVKFIKLIAGANPGHRDS
jgi:2-dehydropantoate 2-reductase